VLRQFCWIVLFLLGCCLAYMLRLSGSDAKHEDSGNPSACHRPCDVLLPTAPAPC